MPPRDWSKVPDEHFERPSAELLAKAKQVGHQEAQRAKLEREREAERARFRESFCRWWSNFVRTINGEEER